MSFNPLNADHPLVTYHEKCAVCHKEFQAGDVPTWIAVEQTAKGGTAVALPAHASCVENLRYE